MSFQKIDAPIKVPQRGQDPMIFTENANYFVKWQAETLYPQINKWADDVNVFINWLNDAKAQTEQNAKDAKGYRDEAYEYAQEAKSVVIPTEATYSKEEIDLRDSVMTKAEFEALAETRRKMFAGSGIVEFGDCHPSACASNHTVNDGMFTYPLPYYPNKLFFGYGNNGSVVNINGNYVVLKYIRFSSMNAIELPQPPTSVAHITDSTNLPIGMKQGDFAILDDLNRELVTNGTFDNGIDGWTSAPQTDIATESGVLKASVNDEGNLYYGWFGINFYVIKGIKYKISIDYIGSSDNIDKWGVYLTDSNRYLPNFSYTSYHPSGSYEIEFIAKKSGNIQIQIIFDNNDHSADRWWKFDNISIRQVEEQPIVALQDVSAGTDIYANADKFEARDSISRQDLVFLEAWYEKIADKDVVYPFGNTQYRGGDVDGLSGITDANWFTGYDTYSLFGVWQNAGELVGKGYRWSQLSESQKRKLASNPENNIFIDENGDWIQFRYRIRVVKGLGNEWSNVVTNNGTNSYGDGLLAYDIYRYAVIAKGKSVNTPTGYELGQAGYGGFRPSYWDSLIKKENGYFYVWDHTYPNKIYDEISCNGKAYAIPIALVQR